MREQRHIVAACPARSVHNLLHDGRDIPGFQPCRGERWNRVAGGGLSARGGPRRRLPRSGIVHVIAEDVEVLGQGAILNLIAIDLQIREVNHGPLRHSNRGESPAAELGVACCRAMEVAIVVVEFSDPIRTVLAPVLGVGCDRLRHVRVDLYGVDGLRQRPQRLDASVWVNGVGPARPVIHKASHCQPVDHTEIGCGARDLQAAFAIAWC